MMDLVDWVKNRTDEIDIENITKIYDITFTCDETYDDRGDWSNQYIDKISKNIIRVSYNPKSFSLLINDDEVKIRSIRDYVLPRGKILVDATSLAFPEIVHIFTILNHNKADFDLIYVQPDGYTEKNNSKVNAERVNTFELSDDGIGLRQIPPFIGATDNSIMFITLGFEGHRLGSIINSEEYNIKDFYCLIGTPPFKVGWENIALSNNYKNLDSINRNMNAYFSYAGANDPVKTYETINNIYKSSEYEKKKLCLVPFGTKPSAIAIAQFAVNNDGIVVIYDFVKKKRNRSSGVDLLNTWSFTCNHTC